MKSGFKLFYAIFSDITRSQLERTRDLMNRYAIDSLVTEFEEQIDKLTLPDPDDCHVLAAAIHCHADIILTRNLKDFPQDSLIEHGIVAKAPDSFIYELLIANPTAFVETVRQHRANLKNPPKTVDEYLTSLEQQGLTETVKTLRQYEAIL